MMEYKYPFTFHDCRSNEPRSAEQTLLRMYKKETLLHQVKRLQLLHNQFRQTFGTAPEVMVSAPGRTELGGNHTDHNHGRVLAAAVDLDCLALVAPTTDRIVRIRSHGFEHLIEVDLNDTMPRPEEEGRSEALVRGVAHGFLEWGRAVCGFEACVDSTIPVGAGLSSSAAFENMVTLIFSALANDGAVPALERALASRQAENLHFAKPCGFMDQIACTMMGVLGIDFVNPDEPVVTPVNFDFKGTGYTLAVVNTGGDHANLTPEYAAIFEEMGKAARAAGKKVARGLTLADVMRRIPKIRKKAGDRGLLRLLHFIHEDERAAHQVQALRDSDMSLFLKLVQESGDSSLTLLQNCMPTGSTGEQPIPVGLALTREFLGLGHGGNGACRIHGGGFAGSMQVFVPDSRFEEYREFMDGVFGRGAVVPLQVRQAGDDCMRVEFS